ncbi:unnamed protein product [Tuwongella immobilis]|uniref:Uncharacterized protein n=1 Tax=Tuwongella immobilis TaxID=692036 RepID=A0A6C2YT08_9BACT|nr:unnamed protein product [Tuwongella immobilis]VTS06296.1 unnamed protein product [Tuwongella immobilis]
MLRNPVRGFFPANLPRDILQLSLDRITSRDRGSVPIAAGSNGSEASANAIGDHSPGERNLQILERGHSHLAEFLSQGTQGGV